MRTIRIIGACVICASIVQAQVPPTVPQVSPTPSPSPAASPAPKPLDVLWRTPLPAAEDRYALPFIVPGSSQIFVSGEGIGVSAFDLDGHPLWTSEKSSSIAPVLVGDRIVVFGEDVIVAFDQRTGQSAWEVRMGGKLDAGFTAGNRIGVVADGKIQTWDADGKPSWNGSVDGALLTPVCATADLIIFGTDKPALRALDPATGAQKWSAPLKAKPYSLVATSDRAYFAGDDGRLHSFQLSGKIEQKWGDGIRRPGAIGQPLADGKYIYFSLLDNSIRAFAAGGGTQQWEHVAKSRPVTGPFRLGANIAVALGNGQIVEVSPKDHKPVVPEEVAVTNVRLLGAAVSPDNSRVYTVTIAGDQTRTLLAWSRPAPH